MAAPIILNRIAHIDLESLLDIQHGEPEESAVKEFLTNSELYTGIDVDRYLEVTGVELKDLRLAQELRRSLLGLEAATKVQEGASTQFRPHFRISSSLSQKRFLSERYSELDRAQDPKSVKKPQ